MNLENAEILWNRPVGADCRHLGLSCGGRFGIARPGQFAMLRVGTGAAPLLRRPFSIHQCTANADGSVTVEFLMKLVGAGTRLLADRREGDRVDIFGPLGRGYTLIDDVPRIAIVAGGIGVAPMPYLVRELERRRGHLNGVSVFLGGRTRQDLLCREFFESLGLPTTVTTDDGTAGDQCFVTHPFESAVDEKAPDMVYACGPIDMLRCILDVAVARDLRCELSIEAAMACGMGVCLGCAVARGDGGDGYFHACRDGPVFDARRIHL